MSLFMSFNGNCSDQIGFYFYMRMAWNALAIGRVRWRPWRIMLKQRSQAPRLFLM
jgi:hypothetical protein